MTASTGANVGIVSGYDPGDNGWGPDMNVALRAIDALLMGMTRNAPQAAPPGVPVKGDSYIIADAFTSGAWVGHENEIATWVELEDGSFAWQYQTPRDGWKFLRVPSSTAVAVTVYMYRDGAWEIAPETIALVPAGGTTGQILVKDSATDYDYSWEDPPYEIAFAYPGAPGSNAVLVGFVLTRDVDWPANFSGSELVVDPAATSTWTTAIKKNGTDIGAAVVSAAGTAAAFTTVGGTAKSGVAGDVITWLAPSSVDGTAFTLIVGTLAGTR